MTDSTSPPKFAVGDKVILVRRRHYSGGQDTEIPTEVTKVGRKYFWVADGRHYEKFHLSTGSLVSNYTADCHVTTPELRADLVRYQELIEALRERGVRFDWQSKKLSTATLTVILAAVDTESGV